MKAPFTRTRLALVGLLAISSACSTGGADSGSGGAGTGGKGSGGTVGVGGAPGTGGVTGIGGGTADSGVAADARGDTGSGADAAGNTAPPPSCAPGGPGMTDCGPGESCCTSLGVTGGMYFRTYRNNGSGPTGTNDPAKVSDFRLDKYLVTVGPVPPICRGMDRRLETGGGRGQARLSDGRRTGGDRRRHRDRLGHHLEHHDGRQPDDQLPHAGELLRFGARDVHRFGDRRSREPADQLRELVRGVRVLHLGRRLPAQRSGVGVRGRRRLRAATVSVGNDGAGDHEPVRDLRHELHGQLDEPRAGGDRGERRGQWGQLDLAGQVWEWVLDWKQTYVNPCTDCVNLTPAQFHIVRGDNFGGSLNNLMPIVRGGDVADPGRDSNFGVRCARAP